MVNMNDGESDTAMQALCRSVFSESSARVFLVGPLPETFTQVHSQGPAVIRADSLVTAEQQVVDAADSYDRDVLVYALQPEDQPLNLVLGRAIRRFPYRVILLCTQPADACSTADSVFFSFGFHKITQSAQSEETALPCRWFEYQMSRYKALPDWLNARFWANPERYEIDEDPDAYCLDDEEE